MQSRGFKGLLSHLEGMYDDIDDDVDVILKNNAIEGVGIAVSNAKKVMNKGYWTGNLARSIEVKKMGELHYRVISTAHYSGFLEFGTRYMEAAPFMFPTYQTLKKSTLEDLRRLLNG
ncbi:HK97-gp10 family putative phage morphogenesis protein [Staphylococcus delphini]|uniref:HK97-gp10 family putative phage morphogenesis protein n=1 Tax=Staphylococcus delphini TaxID=53344 RepID=UPI0023B23BB1|nr:HK97-gp10 family putative phage morphogenesis protein [Staphylococcus delphini]EKC6437890.1 HK97 gp10 family phage protein [Staphylococcus pseudintermedius]MDE9798885.1 HK97 gp10 family phage protein [Staphylococcus delphini]MDE9806142.1 HK97 gp10 family phage protein [Staphylococcus delphini]